MQGFEIYNFIVSLIVFIGLTALFSVLIVTLIKLTLRTVRGGLDDDKIKLEYAKKEKRKQSRVAKVVDMASPIFICALLGVVLCFSMYSRFTENGKTGDIPTLKVVNTGSMETKHKENTYLYYMDLNDQIQTFDLIVLHQLPKKEDLKVYDIVVYEVNGFHIVHRIVGIEEPNEKHPGERWFVLRGDANKQADDFPVRYSQMKSIYRGERVPFVGSFVLFMQSPAGMLCFLLVLFAVIATPIAEKKIAKAKYERYKIITAQAVTVADVVVKNEELAVAESVIKELDEQSPFSFDGFGERKTFKQKLALLDAEKLGWYEQLVYVLNQLPNIRVIDAKYHQAYRKGNKPIAKVAIKGKSLYVYLAVDASKYQGVQYGFKDVSGIKAHGQFTAECKVTSARKLKNVKKLLASYGENVRLDTPVKSFEDFKKKKPLTFKQKLSRLNAERKERIKEIIKILEEKVELTKRESKSGITFKQGRKPMAKLAIKGKSVYAYLAIGIEEQLLNKIGGKDVSSVKKYKDYPVECKITSDRKAKNVIQIIKTKI